MHLRPRLKRWVRYGGRREWLLLVLFISVHVLGKVLTTVTPVRGTLYVGAAQNYKFKGKR